MTDIASVISQAVATATNVNSVEGPLVEELLETLLFSFILVNYFEFDQKGLLSVEQPEDASAPSLRQSRFITAARRILSSCSDESRRYVWERRIVALEIVAGNVGSMKSSCAQYFGLYSPTDSVADSSSKTLPRMSLECALLRHDDTLLDQLLQQAGFLLETTGIRGPDGKIHSILKYTVETPSLEDEAYFIAYLFLLILRFPRASTIHENNISQALDYFRGKFLVPDSTSSNAVVRMFSSYAIDILYVMHLKGTAENIKTKIDLLTDAKASAIRLVKESLAPCVDVPLFLDAFFSSLLVGFPTVAVEYTVAQLFIKDNRHADAFVLLTSLNCKFEAAEMLLLANKQEATIAYTLKSLRDVYAFCGIQVSDDLAAELPVLAKELHGMLSTHKDKFSTKCLTRIAEFATLLGENIDSTDFFTLASSALEDAGVSQGELYTRICRDFGMHYFLAFKDNNDTETARKSLHWYTLALQANNQHIGTRDRIGTLNIILSDKTNVPSEKLSHLEAAYKVFAQLHLEYPGQYMFSANLGTICTTIGDHIQATRFFYDACITSVSESAKDLSLFEFYLLSLQSLYKTKQPNVKRHALRLSTVLQHQLDLFETLYTPKSPQDKAWFLEINGSRIVAIIPLLGADSFKSVPLMRTVLQRWRDHVQLLSSLLSESFIIRFMAMVDELLKH